MSDTEIVRGEGRAPGESAGEQMPSIDPNAGRAGLGDFQRMMREKNEAARNGGKRPQAPAQKQEAPPTSRSHVASFSERLEASQQAPVNPNEPRESGKPENMGDPNQLKEPGNVEPQAGDEKQQTKPEEGEQPPEEQQALDDRGALEKFRQWEKDDMFPEELLGKMHEVKVNGQMRYVDGKELRQGYMRGGDYRRLSNEAQRHIADAQQYRQSIDQHFQAIRDENQMLEIYERNGYGQTLEKLADLVQARRQRRQQIVEGAGIAAMRALGLQRADWNHKDVQAAMQQAEQEIMAAHEASIEKRRLAFERQQFDQSRQQQESTQRQQELAAVYERQLSQLRPNAFRAYGLQDTPGNRQALARHIGNNISVHGFKGDITRELVMQAAADLRDEQDDIRARERNADMQQPGNFKAAIRGNGAAPLPPQRLGGGAGQPLGNTNGKQRGSLRDLEDMVRKSRFGS